MPLNDTQRELLGALEEAKKAVEAEVQAYSDILRDVRKWDVGAGNVLIPDDMTDAEVIAIARTRANARRLDIIAAAEAIPEV